MTPKLLPTRGFCGRIGEGQKVQAIQQLVLPTMPTPTGDRSAVRKSGQHRPPGGCRTPWLKRPWFAFRNPSNENRTHLNPARPEISLRRRARPLDPQRPPSSPACLRKPVRRVWRAFPLHGQQGRPQTWLRAEPPMRRAQGTRRHRAEAQAATPACAEACPVG